MACACMCFRAAGDAGRLAPAHGAHGGCACSSAWKLSWVWRADLANPVSQLARNALPTSELRVVGHVGPRTRATSDTVPCAACMELFLGETSNWLRRTLTTTRETVSQGTGITTSGLKAGGVAATGHHGAPGVAISRSRLCTQSAKATWDVRISEPGPWGSQAP